MKFCKKHAIHKNSILFFVLVIVSLFIFVSCAKNIKKEINIGLLIPLSGPSAQYGSQIYNGALLCVDEINKNMHLSESRIKLIKYDEEDSPVKAKIGYEYLVNKGVFGIIGSATSLTTSTISALSKEDNLPLITPTATSEEITYDSKTQTLNDNVFRTCFLNSYQGEKLANFAKEVLKTKTACVLYCYDSDYSVEIKEAFENKCKENGIKILLSESFSSERLEFQSQIAKIKEKKPDVLFIPYYYNGVAIFLTQTSKENLDCIKLGSDGWCSITTKISDEKLLDNSYYFSGYSLDDTDMCAQNFLTSYKEKFNEEPNMFAAQSYDATKILIFSIKENLNKNLEFNSLEFKKAVVNSIKNSQNESVSGKIVFDEHNNPVKQAIIIQIKDNKEKFFGRY